MELKGRRTILGNLAALLAAPFFMGRATLIRALAPAAKKNNPLPPRITLPAHSVKRLG